MSFFGCHDTVVRMDFIKDRILSIFKILGILSFLLLVILSLVPGSERPHTGVSGNIEHLAAYSGTAWLLLLGFGQRFRFVIISALVFASAVFEIIQNWLPGRGPGIDNWAFSSLGAVLGVLIAIVMLKAVKKRSIRQDH